MITGKKLFIHIPKNGGMSIRHPQSKFQNHIVWPNRNAMTPEYQSLFEKKMRSMGRPNQPYEHARWRDLSRDLTMWHDAFAIVRNPWSRVVSRYTFAVRNDNDWDSVVVNGKKTGGRNMTFDEFLEQRFQYDEKIGCGMNDDFTWHLAIRGWWNAYDYVSDNRGKVRCDIMRFEHYAQDVNRYFNFAETPIDIRNVSQGKKSEDMKSIANRKDYKDFYNEKQIGIVADWYKKDIEYWGFDFDTAATKNYWNM